MFKKILFPVDFTHGSDAALRFALELAESNRADLHLLHVVLDLKGMNTVSIPHPAAETFTDELKKSGEKLMKDFSDKHYEKIKNTEYHVVVGDPSKEVLRFAEDNGFDLILVSSHSRGGLERLIFGSVTDSVVRHSKIPVLTINPDKMAP